MPELPEVETVANGVHARVRGQQILRVWTSGKPQTFKSPEPEIAEVLTGATIAAVRRVGKTIVMQLARPGQAGHQAGEATFSEPAAPTSPAAPQPSRNPAPTAEFLIHLGMTGRLLVSQPAVHLPPHTHAVLSLADGRELRFVDPRRFGRLSVHRLSQYEQPATGRSPNEATVAPAPAGYTGPGREPLTISATDFAALFRRRRTPIKAALLNQSILTGIGNIYADEALARARIRPRRQAARLTRAELTRLHTALLEVLRRAIALGGSSVSDYVDADGIRGFFQLEHLVYSRTGQPCRTCATPIQRILIAGRGTHFCPTCQK